MKNIFTISMLYVVLFSVSCNLDGNKNQTDKVNNTDLQEENDMYDGAAEAANFEFERTKDPALGYVPTDRLLTAINASAVSKTTSGGTVLSGTWVERGPNADLPGSYGNPRDGAGTASTSGRIRAMLVDAADATGKTVFIGGVDGGLWKTTDITATTLTWTLVNDNLSNLAVTDITQDPTNSNIKYFCTGESYNNSEAVRGVGIFKSTDGGISWTSLSSTSTYVYCTRILCDFQGNIYLATKGSGLLRSTKASGGNSWTNITPTGIGNNICDLEISSTTISGRLHVVAGIFSSQAYRFTDNPDVVSSTGFTAPTNAFPSFSNRAEIAVNGNTLYALPADGSYQVPTIYKSTVGGVRWVATGTQPGGGTWANRQGWYSLAVNTNPADANQCIIGGLDTYKTIDGGATWTKLTQWYGSVQQYMHADHHKILWYDGGNKLLFANDGGVFYSADGGTNITDKNKGLRIKQFYSCAIHPSSINYFLAGAQDNGTHAFGSAGLSSTTEITGGDGAFVAIDQLTPANQFAAYVYQTFRVSTDNGVNWPSVNFYTGTNGAATNFGNFINPFVFDNTQKIIYSAGAAGNVFRWTTPLTTASNNYYFGGTPSWPSSASQVGITSLGGSTVSALAVSPYISNRVYLGTNSGSLCYIDAANTIASGSAGTSINTGLPTGVYTSCIATGTNDQNLMVCYSNYGVQQIWVSTNGGTSWTNIDGNLPDMPVRWCMFAPGNNTKAIIATEAGVWVTTAINGASTVWSASPTFPAVRTDMLQYRPLDGLVAAATHGRGLWTQVASSVLPLDNFKLNGMWTGNDVKLNWSFEDPIIGSSFEIETSLDGINYSKAGIVAGTITSKYGFAYSPNTTKNIFYRIKVRDLTGMLKYSNVINLFKANANNNDIVIAKFFPNPIINDVSISFATPIAGKVNYAVVNAIGQTIWQKQEDLASKGSYSISENFAMLKAGTYFFTININDKKTKYTFIKNNSF